MENYAAIIDFPGVKSNGYPVSSIKLCRTSIICRDITDSFPVVHRDTEEGEWFCHVGEGERGER